MLSLALVALAIGGALASPTKPLVARQASGSSSTPGGDAAVLNYALTLEHLENAFYTQGLANFSDSDFSNAGFLSGTREYFTQIASDEATHVSALTAALSAAGATPVQACTYNFGVTSAAGFVALSQVLEGVGVSAYIGAAPEIASAAYLEVAGEILTVEARHNAFVRLINGYSPFPAPFDTAATPQAVVSLAGSFFGTCPSGSAPNITAFPVATLNTATPTIGGTINVTLATASNATTLYCGFASGPGFAFSTYANNQCQIPSTNVTAGQTYGYITSDNNNITDANTVAGPFILELDTKNTTAFSSSKASASGSSSGSSSSPTPNSGAAQLAGASALALVGGLVAVLL